MAGKLIDIFQNCKCVNEEKHLQLLAANALAALLDLFGNVDEIDARAAAGRAGNYLNAVAPQIKSLENIKSCIDLLDGVGSQRNPNGIADSVHEQTSDSCTRFNKTHDIGIAGGDGCAVLIKKGEIIRKIKEEDIVSELLAEIDKI